MKLRLLGDEAGGALGSGIDEAPSIIGKTKRKAEKERSVSSPLPLGGNEA